MNFSCRGVEVRRYSVVFPITACFAQLFSSSISPLTSFTGPVMLAWSLPLFHFEIFRIRLPS